MDKDYHNISGPKTDYPYSRLQLFQDLKIPPRQTQSTYDQQDCVFLIKDQLYDMDQFGYDFWYSSKQTPQKELKKSLRRKVKLQFHCQKCKKWWTSIVGTIQIKFEVEDIETQETITDLVNFSVKLYQMQCESCLDWGKPYIYQSQLITVAQIFCLTISEILEQVERPKRRRIKDDRHKMNEDIHDHKTEMCEACQIGKCFARPKNETSPPLK